MADASKPTTPRRSKAPSDPEALAFAVIVDALGNLSAEAAHRTLDHAAKRYGFYVVHELPAAELQIGAQVGSNPGMPEYAGTVPFADQP